MLQLIPKLPVPLYLFVVILIVVDLMVSDWYR